MAKVRAWSGTLMGIGLLALLLWLMTPSAPADAQAGITNFDNVTLSGDLLAGGDGTFGGNLAVTGAIVAADYFTDDGDIIIPGNWTFEEDVTVTGLLTVTGATRLESTTNMIGNVSDSGGAWTVADNALIDGQADVIQLTVQGNATQTSNPNLFVVENSGGTDQFTVNATGDATVADDLTVTDDAAVNDLTVADFANITAQNAIALTSASTLTATGSLQPISSVAAAYIDGGTKIAHVTDYLILVNTGAQTITFTETTGLISAGNIALGAGDSATLVWANSGWIEIAASNN